MFRFQNTHISPKIMIPPCYNSCPPNTPDFWNTFETLKIYFAVSKSYILKKMFIVLYPMTMRNQSWGRVRADEAGESGDAVLSIVCVKCNFPFVIV
jgi:YIF1